MSIEYVLIILLLTSFTAIFIIFMILNNHRKNRYEYESRYDKDTIVRDEIESLRKDLHDFKYSYEKKHSEFINSINNYRRLYNIHHFGEDIFEIEALVFSVARRKEINLSRYAIEMLVIPALEEIEIEGDINRERLSETYETIINAIVESPAQDDKLGNTGLRTSKSIIKAFWNRFCNIPPFCSGTDREQNRN